MKKRTPARKDKPEPITIELTDVVARHLKSDLMCMASDITVALQKDELADALEIARTLRVVGLKVAVFEIENGGAL